MDLETLLAGWNGEHAVVRYDDESGAWMFVCVHSTVRGPAGGGTRLRVYPGPAEALADAMRLSEAMTRKMAAAGMARGGGKAVLAVPELPTGEPRRRLLRRYGELVASLGGSYRTAGDMNISPADLDVVAETCSWVYGTTRGGGDSGRGTARGGLHAIRATVEHLFGSPDLAGRSVLVQGAGAVGFVLARELAEAGASVLVSDVDKDRAAATGCETVPPERALETEVDVYSPCAVGGTLNAGSIPRLACRAVVGCANNQLAEPEDAERLHQRGILYAPDYVVNAGGIIQLIGLEDEGWDEARLEVGLAGIGDTLRELFAEAEADSITPAEAADRLVRRRLAEPNPVLREVAEYPNSFGPLGPGDERIETERYTLYMGAGASWNTVQRQRFPVADLDDVLEEVRATLRDCGRTKTQWEVGSSAPAGLVDALLERGLAHDRDPYAVALVLTHEPPPGPPDAVARRVEAFDDFVAACEVQWEAFESSPEEIAEARAVLESRWRDSPIVRHAVWLDGEIVCTGTAAPTEHGLLLYGGATLSRARGRGAYRALVRARWDDAVSRGTPALITQGGSMSRPILERLGFEPVGHVHMLMDDFGP